MTCISFVIPVFNERLTIRTLIDRVRAVPIRKEIIVVDDASSDGTADVVRAIAAVRTRLVSRRAVRTAGMLALLASGCTTGRRSSATATWVRPGRPRSR